MSKITESAKGQNCTVRLPGCSFDPATTVFAHIAGVRFGHGMAKKTKLGAYACHKCHDLIDSRVPRPEGMTRQDIKLAHYEATMETLLQLDEKGLINL
ncbi:MAG: DUF1364 domain-containing protein [Methylobacter sp.]|jgi:hypothetical protein|nr:DUF1364 domain-containing protein [Methylobacter sp.]